MKQLATIATPDVAPAVRKGVVVGKEEMFRVVHPLDDQPEEKRNTEGLGRIRMTPTVKISLMVLRGYLSVMTLMLIYHFLDLSGILGK